MSATTRPRWSSDTPPGPAWDPTTAPYVSPTCRSGGHDRRPDGLLWFGEGVLAQPTDVPCACDSPECSCAANAEAGQAK
jgi:hypothetical protein